MILKIFHRLYEKLKITNYDNLLHSPKFWQRFGNHSVFVFIMNTLGFVILLTIAALLSNLDDLSLRLWAIVRISLATITLIFAPGYVAFALILKQKAFTPDVPALSFFFGLIILVVPGSIAYSLNLPLQYFTIVYLFFIYSALIVMLVRFKKKIDWHERQFQSRNRWSTNIIVWLLLAIAGMLMIKIGSHPAGDSVYHRVLVQRIITTNITSTDLLWYGQNASPAYGWSPWHLAIAMISYVSKLSVQETWFYLGWVAVVVSLSTFYCLAKGLTNNYYVATLVVTLNMLIELSTKTWQISNWSLMLYPNRIAFLILMPLSVYFFWQCIFHNKQRLLWVCTLGAATTLLTHTVAYLSLIGIVLSALMGYSLIERKGNWAAWRNVFLGLFLLPFPFLLYRTWIYYNSYLFSLITKSITYLDPAPTKLKAGEFFIELSPKLGFLRPQFLIDSVLDINVYDSVIVFVLILGLLIFYSKRYLWARLFGYNIIGVILLYLNPLIMPHLLRVVSPGQLTRFNIWLHYYIISIVLCWTAFAIWQWFTKGKWLLQGTMVIILILIGGQYITSPFEMFSSNNSLNIQDTLNIKRTPPEDTLHYFQFIQNYTPEDSIFMMNAQERVPEQRLVEFTGRYVMKSEGWHIAIPEHEIIKFVMDPSTDLIETVDTLQGANIDYLFLQDVESGLLRKLDLALGMGARVYFDESVVIYDVEKIDYNRQINKELSQNQLLLEGVRNYSTKVLDNPDNPHLQLLLGQLYELSGDWQTAVLLYQHVLQIASQNSFMWNFARDRLEITYASNNLNTTSASNPLLLEFKTYLNRQSYQDIKKNFQVILTNNHQLDFITVWDLCHLPGLIEDTLPPECQVALLIQDEFDKYLSSARIDMEIGKYDEVIEMLNKARTIYQKTLDINPNLAETYVAKLLVLGTNLYGTGESETVYNEIFGDLVIVPNDTYIGNALTKNYLTLGNQYFEQYLLSAENELFQKAVEAYRQAFVLDTTNEESQQVIFQAYLATNDDELKSMLDQSLIASREAIVTEPDNLNRYFELAQIYQRMGQRNEALSLYQQAATHNPDDPQAYYQLGRAYQRQNDVEQALAHYTRALELKPDWALVYRVQRDLYRRQNDIAAEVKVYQEAANNNPSAVWPRLELGKLYLEQAHSVN